MAELHEILSVTEAAELAGVTPGRLRQLIEDGRLRGKKIGNSWAILARDVDTFMGRKRGAGRPDEQQALAGRLFVDLRGKSPIQIQLKGQIPDVYFWFKADNRSALEVELDRMWVEVSIGRPIAEGWMLHRYLVGPNEWNEAVLFHQYLTRDQADAIRQSVESGNPSAAYLRLQVRAYFNTPFGSVAVGNSIEREKGEFPFYL
jgi:excisionase family DNA binding protein